MVVAICLARKQNSEIALANSVTAVLLRGTRLLKKLGIHLWLSPRRLRKSGNIFYFSVSDVTVSFTQPPHCWLAQGALMRAVRVQGDRGEPHLGSVVVILSTRTNGWDGTLTVEGQAGATLKSISRQDRTMFVMWSKWICWLSKRNAWN